MKELTNKHRTDLVLNPGDLVFIKLRPHRQVSISQGHHKLSKRYYGPYKIIRIVGPVAYEVELPPSAKLHNVFHISQLKKAHGVSLPSLDLPPQFIASHPILEPMSVVGSCVVSHNGQSTKQVLIR